MGRPKIDYAKAYRETKVMLDVVETTNIELTRKYDRLNLEFDKAVKEAKRYKEMLYEQRGVIGYLETQVKAMDQKLTELENK
jgi:hypothetical protein